MQVWRSMRALNNPVSNERRRRRQGRSTAARAKARRELFLERFEDRLLMAGPQLISIVPNDGDVLIAGQTRHVAPSELTLRFNEGQVIDPATLGGIQIVRAGADRALGTADDVAIIPGFRGIGDRPSEVVVRFAETLSDDLYRIQIASSGPNALFNIPPGGLGGPESFDPTGPVKVPFDFRLDLAPQVLAIVPQPITRNASGVLEQATNQIDVYFNDDDLQPLAIAPSNLDPNLFQLVFTNNTLTTADDQRFVPDTVSYNPATDKAVLSFGVPLDALGTGAFRLRIGDDELPLGAPTTTVVAGDPGSTFGDPSTLPFDAGAHDAGHLNATPQQILSAAIEPQPIHAGLLFPGGMNELGHRNIPAEFHLNQGADSSAGQIALRTYNFPDIYGSVPGNPALQNLITPAQKQRAREIFQLYSHYMGIQFVEVESSSLGAADFAIITGVVQAVDAALPTSLPGVADAGRAIMNADRFDGSESEYGGEWFRTAFHEIGHLLGLGHSHELPPVTVQGEGGESTIPLLQGEPVFPGDHDIVHGQYLYRRDSKDIDLYRFVVTSSGTFSAETFAQRQNSLLDTLLTLYNEVNVIRMPRTGAAPVGGAIVDGHRFTIDDGIAPAVTFEFDSDGSVLESPTLRRIAFIPATDNAHDVAVKIAAVVNDAAATTGVRVSAGVQLDRVTLSGPVIVTPSGSLGQVSYAIDRQVIARNDDYFSKDSFVEMELGPGRYFVAVTSTGNSQFDPNVPDSGFGGTTQGSYDLRLGFRPTPANTLTDRTNTPLNIGGDDLTELDGDADGVPGGVHNFWFQVGNTLFVDKQAPAAPSGPLGSIGNPYQSIADALAAAGPGSIVRIVGNGGADGRLDTPADAVAYQVGFDQFNNVLPDGSKMEIPQGVTVMIDAGAVVKLRNAVIDVGSSAQGIDRSAGALSVLGTPVRAGSPGNVVFTSFHDNDFGGVTDFPGNDLPASPGDWGGLVFRDDSDREDAGVFLNYVNQARIRFGGGQVSVDGLAQVYNPVHMVTARPTITYNTITESADAAMSADPNSFEASRFGDATFTSDYDRTGPHIRGNTLAVRLPRVITTLSGFEVFDGTTFELNNTVFEINSFGTAAAGNVEVAITFFDTAVQVATKIAAAINGAGIGVTANAIGNQVFLTNAITANVSAPLTLASPVLDNTVNGLFVRTRSLFGQEPELLEVTARWDDADIVHVVSDNLVLYGNAGGALDPSGSGQIGRDASLAIDPGLIVKLLGSRIEVQMGATLYAEGTAGHQVVFTSQRDDRHGAGGTFDTNGDNSSSAGAAGDWGGLYFAPTSRGSIDHGLITFGGGRTTIEGGFDNFNAVEIRQADVRIANSVLESNAEGLAELPSSNPTRAGRLANTAATVYVLGAQPILVNNIFRSNLGATIDINVNSLRSDFVPDYGRATGPVDDFEQFADNHGPLVRLNRIGNISTVEGPINGMVVRGGTLNVESVWDDVDIVHVLLNEVIVPNFHTFGGLRLQSSATESLVIKLSGSTAGFTAGGLPLDINDRIGGTVQIIGTAAHPVVLTASTDCTVGAGLTPDGQQQNETLNGLCGANVVIGGSGPVFIDGGDRDEHGFFDPDGPDDIAGNADDGNQIGWKFIEQAVNFAHTGSRNTAGNGILVIGTTTGTTSGDAIESAATALGLPAPTYVTGAAISSANFNAFKMIYVPSSEGGTFGGINDADLALLTARKADVQTFVNNVGGGLVALTETEAAAPYAWLELPLPFTIVEYGGGGNLDTLTQTPALAAAGFNISDQELNDGTPWHNSFSGPPGFNNLQPWVISATTGEVVTLGLPAGSTGIGGTGSTPGAWRSVLLDKYSNDRNVAIVNEAEETYTGGLGTNDAPGSAQVLGELAPNEKSGDDNRRLGFEVHGYVSLDDPGDADVYTFKAIGGTEVWLDIDRTTHALDTIVELIDANGNVLARSNDSVNETAASLAGLLPGNQARVMQRDSYLNDVYGSSNLRDYNTTNPRDAGMRVVLPGQAGTVPNTYYVRVRSNGSSLANVHGGVSKGAYQLQVRLRELDEVPGSTVRNSEIKFATNGIEVLGMPGHSPLVGETAEEPGDTGDELQPNAQVIGNLLGTDKNTISVAGALDSLNDVDWYQFTVDYDLIQAIAGVNSGAKTWSTIFDIDYADGLSRANTVISVFDAGGRLILTSRDSNIGDDQPGPNAGNDLDDLSRGSVGKLDPFIGSVQLPEGTNRTYFVAIHSDATLPNAINGTFVANSTNTLVRLEPVNSVRRIAEDHIGSQGGFTAQPAGSFTALFSGNSPVQLNAHATPFNLSDVTLFVQQAGQFGRLFTVDPFTGVLETDVGDAPDSGFGYRDLAMRNDGRLFGLTVGNTDATAGNYNQISTGNASLVSSSDDGIITYRFTPDPADATTTLEVANTGVNFEAITYSGLGTNRRLFAIGNKPGDGTTSPTTPALRNVMFELHPDTGAGVVDPNQVRAFTDAVEIGQVNTAGLVTGMADVNGTIFVVDDLGGLYRLIGSNATLITNLPGVSFTGLTRGPVNVEGGAFANTLFATDTAGRLHAINTLGALQAIFAGGATNINLGVSGVVGLAFSTLDYNLWHVTDRRGLDAGHGVAPSFDNERTGRHEGDTSFYFGLEDPNSPDTISFQPGAGNYATNAALYNTYDLPGGSYGSLTTNSFSLVDYAYADKPTLYFNYYLETERANGIEIYDSARVSVSSDGGLTWSLLTTNNSELDRELPQYITASALVGYSDGLGQRVQELFDDADRNDGIGWRQARVDLGEFAGQSNLVLRFDFSTAGDISDPSSPGDYAIGVPGDQFGRFNNVRRNQANNFEGFYIDDIIIGFAERGEMVTDAPQQTALFNVPRNVEQGAPTQILSGPYQLEIRRGTEYGRTINEQNPGIQLFRSFDTNDRLNQSFKLIAPAGSQVANGQTFRISDGVRTVTFEFRTFGSPSPGNVAINVSPADSPVVLAGKIRTAINNINNPLVLDVRAVVLPTSNRVDLVNAADVINGSMNTTVFNAFRLQFDLRGDGNLHREQGQIILDSNKITEALNFAIVVDAGARDASASLTHPAPVRNLSTLNVQRLVPGTTISNNLIVGSGQGAVHFSGDVGTTGVPQSAVPFGRIVNNTFFGRATRVGVGVRVTENASPTILNNIFANLATGINIDSTSGTTVVGGSIYQNNNVNKTGGGPESFSFALSALEPLFEDVALGNFYLAAGSKAIDSSVQSLPERSAMTAAKSLTGIPGSPILAPDRDLFGQFRVDDPTADPLGVGSSVFKDRGALERADFAGPTSELISPRDNDLNDQNPLSNVVHRVGESVETFAVQLLDTVGSGIDDLSVVTSRFVVRRNGVLLRPGIDYTFSYDSNNAIAYFTSAGGVWLNGSQYTIALDNGVRFDRLDPSKAPVGIRDLAGNLLRANGPDGFTEYNIILDSVGNDAPVIHIPNTQTVNEDVPLVFNAANGNFISIFDVDSGTNNIEVTLATLPGHTLTLGSLPPALGVTGNNTSTITLVGRVSDINAALDGLTYLAALNFNGPATLEITANDLGNFPPPALTGQATLDIDVLAVNDAPINNVPGPQSMTEDTSLIFSAANGNAISVGDVDLIATDTVRVTLTAPNGVITLAGTTGLAFSAGDGVADATMTFTGTTTAINAALDGLVFTPSSSLTGSTTLVITTDDLGNTGSGGPLTDTDTITINVLPLNDPPIVANPIPDVNVNEDAPPTIINLAGVFSDPDVPPAPPLVLSVLSNTNPILVTPTLVNNTLVLVYAANQNGTALITIRARDDQGLSVTTTFRVTVNAVQDPPNAVNDQFVYEMNTTLTVAPRGVLANDVEPDNDPLTAVLFDVPDHGQLVLNANGSFTYVPDANFRGRDSFVYKADDGQGNRVAATVILNSVDSRWVERMYTEVLGRSSVTAIGDAEVNFWIGQMNAGMSRQQIAEVFVASVERRSVIINQLYQTYLGRSVDGPGLGFWLSVWQANHGPERVQAGIIASQEFFFTSGGTAASWVQALYQNLLGRAAGPEEVNFWASQAVNPVTREAVVMGFVTSDEFRLNLIRGFYTTFLKRPIDASGANFWLQQMRNGLPQETILSGILASEEYRQRG